MYHARALYAFDATDSEDLSFPKDAVIEVQTEVAYKASAKGSYKGRTGTFPLNYVESLPQVRALHNFMVFAPDELSFMKGDVITVVESADSAWWKGLLRGATGVFPTNYVQKSDGPPSLRGGRPSRHWQQRRDPNQGRLTRVGSDDLVKHENFRPESTSKPTYNYRLMTRADSTAQPIYNSGGFRAESTTQPVYGYDNPRTHSTRPPVYNHPGWRPESTTQAHLHLVDSGDSTGPPIYNHPAWRAESTTQRHLAVSGASPTTTTASPSLHDLPEPKSAARLLTVDYLATFLQPFQDPVIVHDNEYDSTVDANVREIQLKLEAQIQEMKASVSPSANQSSHNILEQLETEAELIDSCVEKIDALRIKLWELHSQLFDVSDLIIKCDATNTKLVTLSFWVRNLE